MKKLAILIVSTALLATAIALGPKAHSQRPGVGNRFRQLEQQTLAEGFKGLTTNGKPQEGLFALEQTGVSTKPVRIAAQAFLAGLTDKQRNKTLFPVDDDEWRRWANVHFYVRQGVGFDEMNQKQRNLAFDLMQASLSAKGLKKTRDIMKLNGTLAELKNNFTEYGEWLYWITIMGEPSADKPWGWQLDGHHVVINYFVLGDQVVMTPVFMGSEPVEADAGKFKGTVVMQDEQNKGLALMQSLNKQQQAQATIADAKSGTNTLAEAFRDNLVLDYAGIPVSKFDKTQQKRLLAVIEEYVGNMDAGHARVKMDEVRKHLNATYFAWIGGNQADSVFYYRIQSPVVLIEFDHQRPIGLARSRIPTRQHVHSVIRTPNGNDYGKDLLRQHYEKHHSNKKR